MMTATTTTGARWKRIPGPKTFVAFQSCNVSNLQRLPIALVPSSDRAVVAHLSCLALQPYRDTAGAVILMQDDHIRRPTYMQLQQQPHQQHFPISPKAHLAACSWWVLGSVYPRIVAVLAAKTTMTTDTVTKERQPR
jgi:hypothetical protein